jgi:hypothetical protein
MDNATLASIIIFVLLIVVFLVGTVIAYKFMTTSQTVKQGAGSKYGSQMLLNLLDVHQDWDYADSRTPNVFEILPNSQMRVQYWDQGYLIGMSSYIANYTVVSPTVLRLTVASTEKVIAHAPPATLTLTYVNDKQIMADDGKGARALTR